MADEPGTLRRVLEAVEAERGNILDVRHDRAGWRVPVGAVHVDVLVELRSASASARIRERLEAAGFAVGPRGQGGGAST